MAQPHLVIAGKTSMAVDGAKALRTAADARGLDNPILVVPNQTDAGVDDWQPSLRKFAEETSGFDLIELNGIYELPDLYFFSLEFDRLVHTERTESENLFNMHFSLLPAYKGVSTAAWPLIDGTTESGVTLHRLCRGIDTGPIIEQRSFAIGPDDTARDVYFNCVRLGTGLFESMVGRLLDGDYAAIPQPASGSTYFGRGSLDYSDPIDGFAKTAFQLRNRIRAFTFAEYQLVHIDGLGVHTSQITQTLSTESPGTVVAREAGMRRLATIDYDLLITGVEGLQQPR